MYVKWYDSCEVIQYVPLCSAEGKKLYNVHIVHRGTLRTSGAPKRVFLGPNRPFLPVFDRFLELGGSKWAITVLDE